MYILFVCEGKKITCKNSIFFSPKIMVVQKSTEYMLAEFKNRKNTSIFYYDRIKQETHSETQNRFYFTRTTGLGVGIKMITN